MAYLTQHFINVSIHNPDYKGQQLWETSWWELLLHRPRFFLLLTAPQCNLKISPLTRKPVHTMGIITCNTKKMWYLCKDAPVAWLTLKKNQNKKNNQTTQYKCFRAQLIHFIFFRDKVYQSTIRLYICQGVLKRLILICRP